MKVCHLLWLLCTYVASAADDTSTLLQKPIDLWQFKKLGEEAVDVVAKKYWEQVLANHLMFPTCGDGAVPQPLQDVKDGKCDKAILHAWLTGQCSWFTADGVMSTWVDSLLELEASRSFRIEGILSIGAGNGAVEHEMRNMLKKRGRSDVKVLPTDMFPRAVQVQEATHMSVLGAEPIEKLDSTDRDAVASLLQKHGLDPSRVVLSAVWPDDPGYKPWFGDALETFRSVGVQLVSVYDVFPSFPDAPTNSTSFDDYVHTKIPNLGQWCADIEHPLCSIPSISVYKTFFPSLHAYPATLQDAFTAMQQDVVSGDSRVTGGELHPKVLRFWHRRGTDLETKALESWLQPQALHSHIAALLKQQSSKAPMDPTTDVIDLSSPCDWSLALKEEDAAEGFEMLRGRTSARVQRNLREFFFIAEI